MTTEFGLTATLLPQVTLAYSLTLMLLAAYWLWRVGREARQGRVPRVAWWAVAGGLALLLAATLEVPALFGIGAAMLLLAEFWPAAYRPAPQRPALTWPLFGFVLGMVLIIADQQGSLALVAGLALTVSGVAGILSYALWPAPKPVRNSFDTRWSSFSVPEWPDLSLTLTGHGAELKNVSKRPLELAGWSPASINGWLRLRDRQGQIISTLPAGQSAFLPFPAQESGVRVWYTQSGKSNDALLFRADWVPAQQGVQRVLN
ncbi:hypothetical protein Dxin01_01977 [Deinococcus xinjiangensis]|uniref:Uncharacterized protein n=1 Tax=Deinococcus xinjiangensis TaxID=457454 RepID=A0ABP9VDD3_9DEIO